MSEQPIDEDTSNRVEPDPVGSTNRAKWLERRRAHDPQQIREERRRAEFGGFNVGADFFGWLVAVAMTVLLAGVVGAVAAAVGRTLNVNEAKIEKDAGAYGLATAIGLLVILVVAYYAGGYVAGRMSRYDGGRQGVGVWLFGLVITVLVVVVGAIFGSTYNVFDRVSLPSIPIPTDTATWGGVIALASIVVGTLVAAVIGGRVGCRYHRRVDNVSAADSTSPFGETTTGGATSAG